MVDIKGLTVVYPDGTTAVNNFTLSVGAGESVALAGANGAGKTTLMLAIVGVLRFNGEIMIDGIGLNKKTLGEIRKRAGLVFQNPDDQLFMPTVLEDIAFGPKNHGLTEAEARLRAAETLEGLNAAYLIDKSTLKLSGGEKRIAALAAVLATRPSVMLFDEPTAFLDSKTRRVLMKLINGLPQTKIIASHDLDFLNETCGRAALMKDGGLYAEGEPRKLFDDEAAMSAADM